MVNKISKFTCINTHFPSLLSICAVEFASAWAMIPVSTAAFSFSSVHSSWICNFSMSSWGRMAWTIWEMTMMPPSSRAPVRTKSEGMIDKIIIRVVVLISSLSWRVKIMVQRTVRNVGKILVSRKWQGYICVLPTVLGSILVPSGLRWVPGWRSDNKHKHSILGLILFPWRDCIQYPFQAVKMPRCMEIRQQTQTLHSWSHPGLILLHARAHFHREISIRDGMDLHGNAIEREFQVPVLSKKHGAPVLEHGPSGGHGGQARTMKSATDAHGPIST